MPVTIFLPVKGCSLKRLSSSLLQSRTSRIDCFESCKLVCEKKLNVGKFHFTARILPDFFSGFFWVGLIVSYATLVKFVSKSSIFTMCTLESKCSQNITKFGLTTILN